MGTVAYAYDVALVNEDPAALARAIAASGRTGFGPLMSSDGLRQLLDSGHDCRPLVEKLDERHRGAPLLEPQALRAIGLATKDAAHLEAALGLARGYSDVPTTARLLVELGRMTGDRALVEEGRSQLAAMGDVLQLERYGLSQ